MGGAEPILTAPAPLLLLAALALDAAVGGLYPIAGALPSPAVVIEYLTLDLERRLNRTERGEVTRLVRGMIVAALITAAAWTIGSVAATFARSQSSFGQLLEIVLLWSCLAVRVPWDRVRAVRRALDTGGSVAARAAATGLSGRPLDALDPHGIARAAIEFAARALDRQVVAPAFWYILLGLPGALAWGAVEAMSRAIGHSDPRHEQFGMTAARLDDALNFLPARLTAVLIILAAAFVPTANPVRGWRTMVQDARSHRSLNAGWPAAALAGALGLALGGPYRQGEVVVHDPWIGRGRARALAIDIGRTLALYAVTCLLVLGLVGALLAGLARL
ncbi:MAG: cobalamin biosynthesis protein [Azospirillum sp.]|nr:cobalamin biosynthesis protein [Azospirillum sp.]